MTALVEQILDRTQAKGAGHRWMGLCPAHDDRSPSLSIREGDRGVLLFCFAGCRLNDVTAALNLTPAQLFYDSHVSARSTPRAFPGTREKVDHAARAFEFDLAALDLRLRADRVLAEVRAYATGRALADPERDRLMDVVARAYADLDRAALFESVADDLREKAFR